MGTDFAAKFAVDTKIFIHYGFGVVVLDHFSRTGAAAHNDIFDRTAETGHFVTFEVVERNKDIRIHNGTADTGGFDIFPGRNGNFHIVCSFQAVTDDDMTSGSVRGKAVLIGTFDMIEGIFAVAHIKGVEPTIILLVKSRLKRCFIPPFERKVLKL